MKTAFTIGTTKTAFQYRADSSLTNALSSLLNGLPESPQESVTLLTNYRKTLVRQNYSGGYKKTILGILDKLITNISVANNLIVHTLGDVQLVASVKMTLNELYQGYLNGTNDGTGIDDNMLFILNEIKSSTIS